MATTSFHFRSGHHWNPNTWGKLVVLYGSSAAKKQFPIQGKQIQEGSCYCQLDKVAGIYGCSMMSIPIYHHIYPNVGKTWLTYGNLIHKFPPGQRVDISTACWSVFKLRKAVLTRRRSSTCWLLRPFISCGEGMAAGASRSKECWSWWTYLTSWLSNCGISCCFALFSFFLFSMFFSRRVWYLHGFFNDKFPGLWMAFRSISSQRNLPHDSERFLHPGKMLGECWDIFGYFLW